MDLAPIDPEFAAHFQDPLYGDVAGDDAPFGSDEGADILAVWSAKRDQLDATSTVRDILQPDVEDVDEFLAEVATADDAGLDSIVIGAGFTLLRLTGQIDDEGRGVLISTLRRANDRYGDRTRAFATMIHDVERF